MSADEELWKHRVKDIASRLMRWPTINGVVIGVYVEGHVYVATECDPIAAAAFVEALRHSADEIESEAKNLSWGSGDHQ